MAKRCSDQVRRRAWTRQKTDRRQAERWVGAGKGRVQWKRQLVSPSPTLPLQLSGSKSWLQSLIGPAIFHRIGLEMKVIPTLAMAEDGPLKSGKLPISAVRRRKD